MGAPAIHPATGDAVLQRMMADITRGEERAVVVRFEKVYGLVKCYPVCQNAIRIAALAGTKTLTPMALKLSRGLGFTIVPQDMSVEALDAFLRSA